MEQPGKVSDQGQFNSVYIEIITGNCALTEPVKQMLRNADWRQLTLQFNWTTQFRKVLIIPI